MFRFIHASDLHLAKPFGRFNEDTRVRLRDARHRSIEKLAGAARSHGAGLILVAGDTFDAELPPPQTLRHALREFGRHGDITWVLMPGNHDSLAATELWERIRKDCPTNVILALEPKPIEIGETVAILPAPPPVRHPGRDLTIWMGENEATTGDRLRIGLAHGAVHDFGEEERNLAVIAPDRAESADLDYLALGDWHGQVQVSDRCWYSGAPEADSFKHERPAGCLLVEVAGRGSAPRVVPIGTGTFAWRTLGLDLRPGDEVTRLLASGLPQIDDRHQALVTLSVRGRLRLSERAALETEIMQVVDDFAHFEHDLSALEIEQEAADLDVIDRGGALRQAADQLFAQAENLSLDEAKRRVARLALARLYQFALENQA